MRRAILGLAFFLLLAAPARAEVLQDFQTELATNGIALGKDGNFWVAEQYNHSVLRMSPSGAVVNRYAVDGEPTSIAADASGNVWVSVTSAGELSWFDATAAVPSKHDKATGAGGGCNPVAIESGGNGRVYFSLPNCGQIGSVAADGGGAAAVLSGGFGVVFDLAASGGKLYAPAYDGDSVRRLNMNGNGSLTTDAQIGATGNPDGVTVDGNGMVWVTLNATGRVARFPVTQNSGTAETLTPAGGTLGETFGIVAANDGRIYVTGKTTHNIARISADGTTFRFFDVGDGEPFQIVNGPDGDLYFTDQNKTRVRRFLQAAPRATTGAAAGISTTVGTASATVESRGAATTVAFDYDPTTAYGATVTVSIPAALGAVSVPATIPGLAPGTTYHVRVRATNEEGTATGADTTFATAAAPPPPPPVLDARASFGWRFYGSRTALTSVKVADLKGGETIKVTCKSKSKGCKFSSKTYKNVKKGTKSLTSLFGRKRLLKKGAKIEVRVTAPGAVGASATVTIGKRKRDPKIARKRINP